VTSIVPTPEFLRASLQPLWNEGQLLLVVLFGSWAQGRGGPGSDLDLAVLPSNGIDEIGLTAEIVRLTHWNDVDVLNLQHADPLTAMEVSRSGLVLFARDPCVFIEFQSLAFRRYVDSEKLRRAQAEALDRFQQGHEPH
jgi:predicted nucleotidyltransferase